MYTYFYFLALCVYELHFNRVAIVACTDAISGSGTGLVTTESLTVMSIELYFFMLFNSELKLHVGMLVWKSIGDMLAFFVSREIGNLFDLCFGKLQLIKWKCL